MPDPRLDAHDLLPTHGAARAHIRPWHGALLGALGLAVCAAAGAAPTPGWRGTPVRVSAPPPSWQAGARIAVDLPLLGRQTWVLHAATRSAGGTVAWQAHAERQPEVRWSLQATATGWQASRRWEAPPSTPPKAAGRQPWRVDTAALLQAEPGTVLNLPLPDGRTLAATVTLRERDDHGATHLRAASAATDTTPGEPVVLSLNPQGLFGVILSGGRELQVVTRAGQLELIDPTAAGWRAPRGEDHLPAPDDVPPTDPLVLGAQARSEAANATPPAPLQPGTVDTFIPLLITYGPGLVTQWGNEGLARLRLSNLVQLANAAHAASGTGIAFRITGWALLRQPEASLQTLLPALRAGSGQFAGVLAARARSGAAVVVHASPFNSVTGSSGSCGLAYVPGAGAQGLAGYRNQVGSLGYVALNDGFMANSYCEASTLAHELGHLLGNAHDRANSTFPGVFAYSYGRGVAGEFGTIMSYVSPRVGLFAAPQLRCGSRNAPCGSDAENVVATMLQTKGMLAALGNPSRTSAASEGATTVAGQLLRSNGSAYQGPVKLLATPGTVSCVPGSSGLYVCRVPQGVGTVTLRVSAPGMAASPAVGSFSAQADSGSPVNGTRFFLSPR